MEPACTLALSANFGNVESWRKAFAAGAMASGAQVGQMRLVFLPREGRLVNQWVAHNSLATVGGVPILALDIPKHPRSLDATASIDALINDINWAAAYSRYQDAVHVASEPCGAGIEDMGDALVIDVRRAGVFERAESMIPGARWCDPATVGGWATELRMDRAVVVYCVFGHEVSRATALRLRALGLNARYLKGGIDGWLAAGHPTQTKAAVLP